MKVAILGATGSIGQSTLNLADIFPQIEVVALSCGHQVELMADLIKRHRPALVSTCDLEGKLRLDSLLKDAEHRPEVLHGPAGQIAVAAESGAEVVVSAIVGQAGLPPTYAAVAKGLKVALANKESLVMAGDMLMSLAQKTGAKIVPVDSEHSAIFQALGGQLLAPNIRRLIITASGGPFLGLKAAELEKVTLSQALKHPNWSMGPKITCDSATLMNKGLEVIEAHHLFNLPYERLEVLVHPQSVVHSIVEFVDGSQISQAGPTDMRLAIAYALSHPERWPLLKAEPGAKGLTNYQPLDLTHAPLTFTEPDLENFRALTLAREAGMAGGLAPIVLTCANEEAVGLFLQERIGFTDICRLVEEVLNTMPSQPVETLDEILAAADEARKRTFELAHSFKKITN